MAKAKFGGYTISFKGQKATMEDVMGKEPLGPSEMTKKIWAFVKKNELGLGARKKSKV